MSRMQHTWLATEQHGHFSPARQWLELLQLNLLRDQYSNRLSLPTNGLISTEILKMPMGNSPWLGTRVKWWFLKDSNKIFKHCWFNNIITGWIATGTQSTVSNHWGQMKCYSTYNMLSVKYTEYLLRCCKDSLFICQQLRARLLFSFKNVLGKVLDLKKYSMVQKTSDTHVWLNDTKFWRRKLPFYFCWK